MCGIAGLIGANTDVVAARAKLMADCVRHRGPDDEGYLTVNADFSASAWAGIDTAPELGLEMLDPHRRARVVLAHRRLSILDLSAAGHQPMPDRSRRFWIVFNGEIYNYVELRNRLRSLGHCFSTESDTEVLLAALAEWGDQALTQLRGMFAFAAFDVVRQEVILARDPFGIKPLYYARLADGSFAFASEMKALTALSDRPQTPEGTALYQFLRFGFTDHTERTMFGGICQLPPGSMMRVRVGDAHATPPRTFWSLPARTGVVRDESEAAQLVLEALSKSIALHMRSDVPVGSCLSGGLDSTSIVALASAMMPHNAAFGTISFVSSDPSISEGPFVEIAEQKYRIESHKIAISHEDIQRDFRSLVRTQETPFGSPSICAQFAVFRAARENGLTVMLDGQGSDELLGGYYTGVSAAIAERLAGGRLGAALSLSRNFDPIIRGAYRRTLLSALGRCIPASLAPLMMRMVNEPLCPEWLDATWFADRGVQMGARKQGRGRNALDEELRLFTTELSLPQLLRYEDRNSMAFGIESRVPFCDVEFAAAASEIPTDLLITDAGETKAPLRRAFRGLVPDEIIARRKVGFNTPDQDWLSALQPWFSDILKEHSDRLPFIRMDRFLGLMNNLPDTDLRQLHTFWRVLSAVLWAEAFDVIAQ
jgi:asparagine synthase (glutamine-hydrolysing)